MKPLKNLLHTLLHGEKEPGPTPQPEYTATTEAGDQLDRTRPSTPNPAADGVPAAEDQIAHMLQLVNSTSVVDGGSANLFTTSLLSLGELYETRILAQRTARHHLAQNNVAESAARLEAARRRYALAIIAHERATEEEIEVTDVLKGKKPRVSPTTTKEN